MSLHDAVDIPAALAEMGPVNAFLATVLATLKDRDVTLPKGSIFYRAQRGIDMDPRSDSDGNEWEEPSG